MEVGSQIHSSAGLCMGKGPPVPPPTPRSTTTTAAPAAAPAAVVPAAIAAAAAAADAPTPASALATVRFKVLACIFRIIIVTKPRNSCSLRDWRFYLLHVSTYFHW
jgi:hypothetical protein